MKRMSLRCGMTALVCCTIGESIGGEDPAGANEQMRVRSIDWLKKHRLDCVDGGPKPDPP